MSAHMYAGGVPVRGRRRAPWVTLWVGDRTGRWRGRHPLGAGRADDGDPARDVRVGDDVKSLIEKMGFSTCHAFCSLWCRTGVSRPGDCHHPRGRTHPRTPILRDTRNSWLWDSASCLATAARNSGVPGFGASASARARASAVRASAMSAWRRFQTRSIFDFAGGCVVLACTMEPGQGEFVILVGQFPVFEVVDDCRLFVGVLVSHTYRHAVPVYNPLFSAGFWVENQGFS